MIYSMRAVAENSLTIFLTDILQANDIMPRSQALTYTSGPDKKRDFETPASGSRPSKRTKNIDVTGAMPKQEQDIQDWQVIVLFRS